MRGFAWLHFNLSHAQAERWLRRHAGLSDNFFEALTHGLHSTRIERADDGADRRHQRRAVRVQLRRRTISTLWISVGQRLVVTARRQPLRSVDAPAHGGQARRRDLRSSAELLEHLLRDAGRRAGAHRARRHRARRRHRRRSCWPASSHHSARELARLRRLLVRLQRLLAPEPSALLRLLQQPARVDGGRRRAGAARAPPRSSRWCCATSRRCRSASSCCRKRVAAQRQRRQQPQPVRADGGDRAGAADQHPGRPVRHERRRHSAGRAPHGFWIMVALIATLTGVIAVLALRRLRPRQE